MNKLYIKEKYPCGYEIEIRLRKGLFGDFNFTNKDGCPLHGKNCKQKGGKNE